MAYTLKNLLILFSILFFIYIFLCYLYCLFYSNRATATVHIIETIENSSSQTTTPSAPVNQRTEETELIDIHIPEFNIILLGDSILDNKNYVPIGKSVFDYLQKMLDSKPETEIIMYAKDNSTIDNVYFQLSNIPITYNNTDTMIVLSVGGNNFLNGTTFNQAKKDYLLLIQLIRDKFGDCKLFLVNLYTPFDSLFQKVYGKTILDWNKFLWGIVENGKADGIVDISNVITEPNDLVYKIEPSVIGGEKISQAIINMINV